jgi:hypothetical protein
MPGAALTTRVVAHRYAVKITMTDYLGSQAWHDELIDLLRTSATPPTVAVIAGKDQELTDEQIAQRWGELGGVHQRCSAKNVRMRWIEIYAALNAEVPPSPRRAHDIAFTLVQALHSPDARQQFLLAGGAYYRRLYEVNPKIPADWRDWNPLARAHQR